MSELWPYLAALIPFVGMAWLFWLVMKSLVEADRRERRAHAQWEREANSQEGDQEMRREAQRNSG